MEISWPDPGDDLILTGGLRGEFHRLDSGERFPSMDSPVFSPPESQIAFAMAERSNLGWLRRRKPGFRSGNQGDTATVRDRRLNNSKKVIPT